MLASIPKPNTNPANNQFYNLSNAIIYSLSLCL